MTPKRPSAKALWLEAKRGSVCFFGCLADRTAHVASASITNRAPAMPLAGAEDSLLIGLKSAAVAAETALRGLVQASAMTSVKRALRYGAG